MVAPKLSGEMPNKPEKKKWMPRMQSSSTQCCLCVVGLFMFLIGIIMGSTGVCLILNYGYFDESLLPPELRSDDGKRTVGIILTVSGLLCVFISVLVSSIYLCSRKPRLMTSDELDKIPSSGRKSSVGSRNNASRGKVAPVNNRKTTPSNSGLKMNQSHKSLSHKAVPSSKDMHSSTVPPNRHLSKQRKRKKSKFLTQKSKLEGIQEKDADAISRKFSEKDIQMRALEDSADFADSLEGSVTNATAAEPRKDNTEDNDSHVDTSSQEKESVTSFTVTEAPQEDASHKPSIVISQHSVDKKPEYDRSSTTSSGFTGSDKDSNFERQLSDLLK